MARTASCDCLKALLKIFLAVFVLYGISLMHVYNTVNQNITPTKHLKTPPSRKEGYKYILQWTGKYPAPFNFMSEGDFAFVENTCEHTNCVVTDDRNLLNLTDFDAIVFNGRSVPTLKQSQLPSERSPKQKYVFGATESADRWPVCNEMFDSFFNWTWTYKLDSDLRWGYISIYNTKGRKVGPAVDMHWPKKMDPISTDLRKKLTRKTKAAAWFVSHCNTNSKREMFAHQVHKQLQKYGWTVDIYGSCAKLKCPRSSQRECDKMVERDYFFYFSFENSLAEDYVTEKLLTALNNYAVPVVFGAANYSRFLPEGSYLDGRKLGAKRLVRTMIKLISNRAKYFEYFRWTNHFTYTQTTGNVDVCNICNALNDNKMVNSISVKTDFREWWNGARHKLHCSREP